MTYDAIVIGVSAGGFKALCQILPQLPVRFALPILIAQHRSKDSADLLECLLDYRSMIRIKQAEEKERLQPGVVYFAPPDYHLLVEADRTLALSIEQPVCHARPSIDVLFESAADVFGERLVGIVLTGASNDGQQGACHLKRLGGLLIVEDPATAEVPTMPAAVVSVVKADHMLPVHQIGRLLVDLADAA
jgi:two-component system chemotaxis response regulator CheB